MYQIKTQTFYTSHRQLISFEQKKPRKRTLPFPAGRNYSNIVHCGAFKIMCPLFSSSFPVPPFDRPGSASAVLLQEPQNSD